MKYVIVISLFINFIGASAQINLVPNWSFQDGANAPECFHYSTKGTKVRWRFEKDIYDWKLAELRPAHLTDLPSPDWEDTTICYGNNSSCQGSRYTYPIFAFSSRYIRIGNEEGVRTSLIGGALIAGTRYSLRYLMRPSGSGDKTQVYFTKWDVHWNSNSGNNSKFSPGILSADLGCQWKVVQTHFLIPNHYDAELEQIVIMGRGGNTNVDDVELYPSCPDTMFIQNRKYYLQYPYPEEGIVITAGFNVDAHKGTGDVHFYKGSKFKFKAQDEIIIKNGFEVDSGADFHAYLAPCGLLCDPFVDVQDTDIIICDTNSFVLSTDTKVGYVYEWYADPPASLDFLEDNDISSPIFAPIGLTGIGEITYTARVINQCEEYYWKTFHIRYDMSGDPNPSFSIYDTMLTDTLAISMNVNQHTEKIKIEILDCDSPANVLKTYEYDRFLDFDSTDFQWMLEDEIDICECYKVRVSTKNFCYLNWASTTFDWPLSPRSDYSVTLYNTVSSTDGCIYCINVTGAKYYTVSIHDAWGVNKLSKSGSITSNPLCLWDASGVTSGYTYYGHISLEDCNDSLHEYSFTVFVNCSSLFTTQSTKPGETTRNIIPLTHKGNEERPAAAGSELWIQPNPAQNSVTVNIPATATQTANISLVNMTGQAVLQAQTELRKGVTVQSLDLSGIPPGGYFLSVRTADGYSYKMQKLFITR